MKTTTTRRHEPESFHHLAADLITRHFITSQTTRRKTAKLCEELSGLLDLITGDMRDLPLQERLPFFLASVEIVAETLATLPRVTRRTATLSRPVLDHHHLAKAA